MTWKLAIAFAIALATHLTLATSPSLADPDTCIAGAPNGSSLTLYDQPDAQSAVLGGIGVGQCNVTVTNQCEGSWCVVVYQNLNGWVDMQYVSGSPVQPPATVGQQASGASQTFEIIGGSGSVTMMGQTQPTPVDPGGTVTLTAIDNSTAMLTMPSAIFPSQPTMQRGPGDVWTGTFGEWAGIPANVAVTLHGVTSANPILVLEGTSAMADFTLEMQLRPVGGSLVPHQERGLAIPPASRQTTPVVPVAPNQAGADSCAQLVALTRRINARADTDVIQEMRSIYVMADLAFGAVQTPQKCQQALAMIAASATIQNLLTSLGGSSTPGPGSAGHQQAVRNTGPLCSSVSEIERAIGQANSPRLDSLFTQLVDEVGIMDVLAATPAQCGQLLDLLEFEGLVDARSVAVQASIDPSNGISPSQAPAPRGGLSAACREVLVIDQALEAVSNRSVSVVFRSSMDMIPMTDVYSATHGECLALLELLTMEGLGSPQQVRLAAQRFGEASVDATPAPMTPLSPIAQQTACDALAGSIRPVLRSGDAAARRAILDSLQSNGVADVANAPSQACAQVMGQLIAASLIPDDGVAREVASTNPTPTDGAACLALGDRVITVVNRGMNREMSALADSLASAGIRSLSGETNAACSAALDATTAAGIGR